MIISLSSYTHRKVRFKLRVMSKEAILNQPKPSTLKSGPNQKLTIRYFEASTETTLLEFKLNKIIRNFYELLMIFFCFLTFSKEQCLIFFCLDD